jgi:hypothetical protein
LYTRCDEKRIKKKLLQYEVQSGEELHSVFILRKKNPNLFLCKPAEANGKLCELPASAGFFLALLFDPEDEPCMFF